MAALKPVTAIQPKGPITAQPVQPVQAAASSQQPAAAATQPIQTQLQTPLLSSTPSAAAQTASQTPAAAAPTTQQPSNPQGASTKAYQPFGSSGAAKGSGSGRSSGSSRAAASPSSQWQPKTQQAASASAKSPASPPQSALSPAQPISTPSSAQSITTAKEAPQQAAQQAAAAALGAIGQSVPVILPSGLFPSDREEQSLQLQFGNFGLTPAAPPANVLKEETVVPITPVEPVKQQSGPVSVRREETAATASAAASAPVSRPSPVSVSAATTVSQPSAQTASSARPAAKEPKQPEPAQSLDSNDQSPNLPRKGGNAGGRSGEKKAAAASAASAQHQQQQQHYQQQYQYQQQQYQQQHLPQRGLAPPAAVPAAMPAAEGYDMSAFNAAPLPYPAPFWPAYPMDMAPETQQMFYEYQPTGAYRSGAPVSPEPKYGSGSSSSQSYRDSGKYAQQAGSQSGDADSGPSPRGSSGQPQSQSPPPVQPPHHFGVPGAQQYPHVYGYHYPYSYPAASFTQYQYPQRMPTHYKSPHYASTGGGYPVSPPDSSSLGASSYAEDDYSKYGMPSQSFYETPAAHVSPTMGMKNQHQSLSSSSSKSQQQQQQASQMGAYAQQGGADLSGVGASSYKSLGITDYSAQDMSRGSPASSFYSPQFGQQGQYQQQYGFMHHGAHHYQPQPPHQGQSGQSSGAGQNPQYS